MSRTRNSAINIIVSICGQLVLLIVGFFTRSFFVKSLSAEYLGINGLFSNILSMLSFVELGVGTAIIYSLYKPIAEKDIKKINLLMNFYRRAYITIGSIILILGLVITPYLQIFIKDMPDIQHLKLYFFLYVLNTALSYFFSYKRSLIVAHQKKYIATLYHDIFYIVRNIGQIAVLYLSGGYLLYLLVQLLCTLIENITISRKADSMFPYLKTPCNDRLDKITYAEIKKNTLAMLFHKIGSVVVTGTDNLLLSKFIGVVTVGLYSNYIMITSALNAVFSVVFNSLTASIGNLGVTESKGRSTFIFNCVNFIGFWIYAFASIALINLFNPFILLWLGEEYLFDMSLVLIIVINFYLTGMRKSVLTFKDALGLYWYDRYKPLFEATINLIASIILVNQMGTIGVFIGTALSTVLTCFWIEPFVLYKYGFNISVRTYFIKYGIYTIVTLATGLITTYMCSLVEGFTIVSFILKMVICALVPNVLIILVFSKTKELQHLFNLIKSIINGNKKLKL